MLNWQDILRKYIVGHSNKIAKTTKPLRDHFGICYFSYHKIDRKGHYSVLVDRPDFAEYYVDQQFYRMDPYLRHPDQFKQQVCYMEVLTTDETRDLVKREYKKFFNTQPGIAIIRKQEDAMECFAFTAQNDNAEFRNLYLNHLPVLQKFCDYFKQELADPLHQMEKEPISLPLLKGPDYDTKFKIIPSEYESFLMKMGMSDLLKKAEKLSSREKDVLRLLVQGKSSKETAALLQLSSRTVEFYLGNIKNKIDCWNKGELFEQAETLRQLGLL